MTRVDVEEFQPTLDSRALEQSREKVYRDYLNNQILPLVKSGVANARLVDSRPTFIGGQSVYQSAILMPGNSGAITDDGKRIDGLRGQVQYSNGRYMFTMSINSVAWSNRSSNENIEIALLNAASIFKTCTFP